MTTIEEGTPVAFDPDAVIPYTWDWAPWLTDLGGDTIASFTLTVSGGMVVDTSANDTTTVTAKLSYAAATGRNDVTCHIVTSAGFEDDRTIRFHVADR